MPRFTAQSQTFNILSAAAPLEMASWEFTPWRPLLCASSNQRGPLHSDLQRQHSKTSGKRYSRGQATRNDIRTSCFPSRCDSRFSLSSFVLSTHLSKKSVGFGETIWQTFARKENLAGTISLLSSCICLTIYFTLHHALGPLPTRGGTLSDSTSGWLFFWLFRGLFPCRRTIALNETGPHLSDVYKAHSCSHCTPMHCLFLC